MLLYIHNVKCHFNDASRMKGKNAGKTKVHNFIHNDFMLL